MTVYALMDNSHCCSELLGIFTTKVKASKWLTQEWFNGRISSREFDSATIEEWEVT